MHHGDLSTEPENVHSLSFLPLTSAIPNLSPVVTTAPHSNKAYQARKLEVRLLSGLLGFIALVSIVGTGMSRALVEQWNSAFRNDYAVLLGVFLTIGSLLMIIRFPFMWYSGVVLERAFELLRQPVLGWLKDLLKGLLVGSVLGAIILVSLYWCITGFGPMWWLPLATILFLLQMVMAIIGPRVLLPMFYSLTPLEDTPLRGRIERMCEKAGIRARGIFVIGFGEKTKKANAALTGLGPAKRIVLSDTLLENLRDDEVEAVFAHEVGHLKLRHIWIGIVSGVLSSYFSLYIVSIVYALIAEAAGTEPSDIALLPLLGALVGMVSFLFGPVTLWLSRWQEFAADRFAATLVGDAGPLAHALEKIGRINLSDPDPHPLLEFLTFSHPSLGRRLERLRGTD